MAKEKFINGITNYETWRKIRNQHNLKSDSRKSMIDPIIEKAKNGETLTKSDYMTLVSCIAVTTLNGKLDGFSAVSTSVLMNERCQKRAACKDSICASCYAACNVNNYEGLTLTLEDNNNILNNVIIPDKYLAMIPVPAVYGAARIESHGDAGSETCAINENGIVRTHPWLVWGVWTKNPDFWYAAFKRDGKPVNMVFILSSMYENKVASIPVYIAPYVDHVFTVYTKDFAIENNITINCGDYNGIYPVDFTCRNCMRCYTIGNTDFYISEIKK